MKRVILLMLAAMSLYAGGAQTYMGNQLVDKSPTASWGNPTRELISLPDDYNTSTTHYPLIIFLHGWGEAGTDLNKVLSTALPMFIAKGFKPQAVNPRDGKNYKFIVVSPQAPDFSYQYTHIQYILADIIQRYRVDESRIYITGLSAGGFGTWTCMTDNVDFAQRVAAIAPISSMAVDGSRPAAVSNAGKYGVGVWSICGTLDDKYAAAIDYTNRVNAVNPAVKARLTGIEGAGHSSACWNKAYNPDWRVEGMNLYEWLLQFKRGTTPVVSTVVNGAPVAHAGGDVSITLPTASVQLQGSGTDGDGSIAAYKWSKVSGPSSFALSSPTIAAPVVSALVEGTYSFRLTVTDNQGATASDEVSIVVKPAPVVATVVSTNTNTNSLSICKGKKIYITKGGDNGKYISGKSFAYAPGDTLVLKASANPYSYFTLDGIHGTATCPIVIINEGGQVKMSDGISMSNCSYIKVTGSGSSDYYGFYVSNYPNATAGVAVTVTGRSSNIEMERFDVYKKVYGVWIKQEASCADSLQYPNWHIDNVKLHDCNFFNINQDCIYAGSTSPNGKRAITCNGATIYPIPLRLSNISIYNLTIDSCNRTGIQLSGADSGYNEIYNNRVTNVGYEYNVSQGAGIAIGGDSYGYVHNNYVRKTFNAGIYSFGIGLVRIENNDIDSSGYLGSVVNPGSASIMIDTRISTPVANSQFYIKNNKIGVNTDANIRVYKSYDQYATGNIICGNTTQSGIAPTIRVVAGIDYTTNCGGVVTPPNQLPVVQAGTDQLISLPVNTATLKGTASDADGSIASYQWRKVSGPAAGTIATPTAAQTTVADVAAGIYVFELAVKDNSGAVAKDSVKLTVNRPPVAVAGTTMTITLPADSVQLNGNASTDADGTITNYNWAKIAGPSPFKLGSENNVQTAFTNLVQGTYQVALKVTDNNGAIGNDTITIIVNKAPNQAPVAHAGIDQAITLPVDSVTLAGSAVDADGTIESYQWRQISGPDAGTIAVPTGAKTSVKGMAAGNYVFELLVKDNEGATAKDTVTVTVNPEPRINQAPTAMAGNHITITLPLDQVTLSGKGNDNDGTITAYSWSKISGPSTFTILSPAQAQTNVNNLVEGTYRFELKVTDNEGAIGKDTVNIIVNAAPNKAPTAMAGKDQQIQLPVNTILLNGNGTDSDGVIASYAWKQVSGPNAAIIQTKDNKQTEVANLVKGSYTFALTVTDNGGLTATDNMQVMVLAANEAPVAMAGADQEITIPLNTVTVAGSGNDADGTIASYTWRKIAGPTSGTISSPGNATTGITDLVQGIYSFELNVQDNQGAVSTDTVVITVHPAPNKLPVAKAGSDITITLPINTATLIGSATDSDGTIVTYAWKKVGGPVSYTINNATLPQTTVTNLTEGIYTFELTATDDANASAKDTVHINVLRAINQAPVANAGNDQVVQLPVNTAILSGSGTDTDGTIAAYSWKQISGPVTSTLSAADQKATTVNGLVAGTYMYELTVTDNGGLIAKDSCTVVVKKAPNKAPKANAGKDVKATLPVNTVSLAGTGSDEDGTIATYRWEKVAGPAAGTITNAAQAKTSVTDLNAGTYTFVLTVKDNEGTTGMDSVNVIVYPPVNKIPVAIAGADQTIQLPLNTVTLTGNGHDTDGTITHYEWKKVAGPVAGTILSPLQSKTTFNELVQGAYLLELTVTDNVGAIAKDTVNVTVLAAPPPPNQAPKAMAGQDITITLPVNTVHVSGKGTDADGTIASYAWRKLSGPATFVIATPAKAQTDVQSLVAGTYAFELKVVDNNGASATDTLQVTVNPAVRVNKVPTVNAGNDQSLQLPVNTVTLSGSANDTDGTISAITWNKIAGPKGYTIKSANQLLTTVSGLTEGKYQFSLTVVDNEGAAVADTMTVMVKAMPPVNVAPTANAGKDQTITLPTSIATVTGTASDPDGRITNYSWKKVSGPAAIAISNAAAATTTVSSLVYGTYVLEFSVTDNDGAIAKDSVTITVNNAPNKAPVANAGSDKEITLPENSVTLSGKGSDVDGTIAIFVWTKISGPAAYTIANANQAATTINNLVAGDYQFELRVIDNSGAAGRDTVNVTVHEALLLAKKAPTADAGQDTVVFTPANSVRLAGTGTATDGTISKYRWKKISGPDHGIVSSPLQSKTTVTNLDEGEYRFELQVTDNKGMSATDTVVVTVKNMPRSRLSVFPNPIVSGDVILNIDANTYANRTVVNVYDQFGHQVYQESFMRNSNKMNKKLNLSHLKRGIYFIEVPVDINHKVTCRIIKL